MPNGDSSNSDGIVNRRQVIKAGGAATVTGLAGCTGSENKPANKNNSADKANTQKKSQDQTDKVGEPKQGSAELTLWAPLITEGPERKKFVQNVIKKFEEEHDAKINLVGVPRASLVKKFRAARAAGNAPHLVMPGTKPGVLTAAKRLDDYFEGSKTAKSMADSVRSAMSVWGRQVFKEKGTAVWPLGIQAYFPVIREDWLKQAGYKTKEVDYRSGTMRYRDELATLYEDLKKTKLGQKKGYYPSGTGMKSSDCEMLSMYIPQFGGSHSGVINEAGTKATINSKEAREAIRMQTEFINKKGYFHPNAINQGDEEITSLHWSGKLADNHIQDTGDLWSGYKSNKPKLMDEQNPKLAFCLPYSGGAKTTMGQFTSLMLTDGAFKSQKEIDMAVKFCDFWGSDPRFTKEKSTVMGLIPLDPSTIGKQDFFGKTELHKQFWRGAVQKWLQSHTITALPAVPGSHAITYEIPSTMYQRILVQGMSIEKATNRAAKRINKVLAKHGRR